MIEFTDSELLTISGWAMDGADKARRSKFVNTMKYEEASAIFKKVHDEYFRRQNEREG